ncbi:MAG: signal peptidase I [Oscillospiraceae bacterium]|jgi:signal peptidase I|nr:signal peptidase I [Oscillospiraceae bacterium]MDD3261673.1 signal peptidase I [Oscillospiraceae bacterium]
MNERDRPTTLQIQEELKRERHKGDYGKTLRTTIYVLLVVAAATVLLATLFFPVLQVTGTSMEPTMETGQIVVALKGSKFRQGDIVAFYYNNKVLLKRVIGNAGDQIDIKKDGTVYVNGKALSEPYLKVKSYGQPEITYPYQVPDGKIFVLGDHRATSLDSRSKSIGCIPQELIVGRIIFRVWPLNRAGGL